jgi:hypothetical protein
VVAAIEALVQQKSVIISVKTQKKQKYNGQAFRRFGVQAGLGS